MNATRRDKRIPKENVLQVLWLHRCMNHPSSQVMANAIRNGSWIGVPNNITPELIETIFDKLDCPACEIAKRHKPPTPLGSGIKCIIPGQSLSVDYKGPISPTAYGGFKGFYIYVCEATGMIKIFLVKLKSEFSSTITKIHKFYKRYGHQVKQLRFDAGSVENSKEAEHTMDELQIIPNGVLKESQYQNAVERQIQTLIDKVGATMCDQSTMGPACWGMAVLHYETTSNATPNSTTTPDTSQNIVMKIMPNLQNSYYFPFGSLIAVDKLGPHNVMLEGRNEFRIFIGNNIGRQGGVYTYKPNSGIHTPDLRNNPRLVKMPQRMMTMEDMEKKTPLISTDGSITFFSAIDEDMDISIQSIKETMSQNLTSDKIKVARHNEKISENEMIQKS